VHDRFEKLLHTFRIVREGVVVMAGA